jgi:transcriptional regulator MraZ
VFVGTFEHSLDDKGRLVLPSAFRGRLADGAFLTPYENCLALWPEDDFRAFVERLSEKVRTGQATPNAMRIFTANASAVKLDSQGRIGVAPRLREYAGLEGEVTLTGSLDHIEIWHPSRWSDVSALGEQNLTDAIANLGIF